MLHMRPGFRENIRSAQVNTVTGSVLSLSSTKAKFGETSMYCNGSGGNYMNSAPVSTFAFGTGSFTIEFWYNPILANTQALFGTRPANTNGPYVVFVMISGKMVLYVNNGSVVTSSTLTANTWQHVALVRNGTSTCVYLNGTLASNVWTDTTNYQAATCFMFNDDYFGTGGGYQLNGYVDEWRVSNIARYTTNFTPATQPFIDDLNTLMLLHFDGSNGSKTIVDDNS